MEADAIRTLIRQKLDDGRLPYDSMPRFWGGPGNLEMCDACDTPIKKDQLVMEGIASRKALAEVVTLTAVHLTKMTTV